MRARAAYIRSLGTTSILVAAALLMLGVVSALVGFHGWPEGAVGETVPSVPVTAPPRPVLHAVRAVRKADPVGRATPARAARPALSTAGLVKVVPVRSPQAVGLPVALAPGQVVPTPAQPPAAPEPAQHNSAPADPAPPKPPAPPSETAPIQILLTQIAGELPPPPDQGDDTQVNVPLVGLTLTVPPVPAR